LNLFNLGTGTPLASSLSVSSVQSQVIALLVPQGSRRATLLVRRGDGQFALEGIDARVASATRVAAIWFRQGAPIVDPATSAVVGYEVSEESAA
jgi:hypothetical protein